MRTLLMLALLAPAIALGAGTNDAGTTAASTFTGIRSPADIGGTVSFDGTEATMSPRFFRSGTVGDPACAEFSTGDFQYQTVDFTSDASGQLTVDFDPGTCDTNVFVTFHTAPFNPANICQNYVWTDGSSIAFTETFPVTPNTAMQMVVSGVANAPGVICGPASYSIVGGNAGGGGGELPFVPGIGLPALDTLGLLVLALGLGMVAWLASRRRTRG